MVGSLISESALDFILITIDCCGYVPKLEQVPPGQAELSGGAVRSGQIFVQ